MRDFLKLAFVLCLCGGIIAVAAISTAGEPSEAQRIVRVCRGHRGVERIFTTSDQATIVVCRDGHAGGV